MSKDDGIYIGGLLEPRSDQGVRPRDRVSENADITELLKED